MKNLIYVVLASIVLLSGCSNITPEMANTLAYTTGYTSCVVVAKTNILPADSRTKVVTVLAAVKPYVDNLTTADNLYDALYPKLVDVINENLVKEEDKMVALTIGSMALRLSQTWLDKHPDFKAQQMYWTAVVKNSIDGAIQALKDSGDVDTTIKEMRKKNLRPTASK